MYYWNNKEERANKAKQHTSGMMNNFSQEIELCHSSTILYQRGITLPIGDRAVDVSIEVIDSDSVKAIFDNVGTSDKLAVLNFASYRNPGGRFLEGSSAQEESLCHASFLFNVLNTFRYTYYDDNNKDVNNNLYRERALFSPDIRFFCDDKSTNCCVITCAAPNWSTAQKYVSFEDNIEALSLRVKFVIDIAQHQGIKILILGAFGCGVFKQDAMNVAKLMEFHLHGRPFDKVIFAISNKSDYNYKSFEYVFGSH